MTDTFAPILLISVQREYHIECRQRRLHWIGGTPTPGDLKAARQAVAHRTGLTPELVLSALEHITGLINARYAELAAQIAAAVDDEALGELLREMGRFSRELDKLPMEAL